MNPADHEPCCQACGGRGGTVSGPCSDCYGTGCTHPTDNATGIRGALARIARLREDGTMRCDARKRDRFGTVHECVQELDHGGHHEDEDGFMFSTGLTDHGLRLRRMPWRAEQYQGETGLIRELVTVAAEGAMDPYAIMVEVSDWDGTQRWAQVHRGFWVVMYDDGSTEVFAPDRFESEFRVVTR